MENTEREKTEREQRVKELAEAMHKAATEKPVHEADTSARGLSMGGFNLWGMVADKLITMLEQMARDAVTKYIQQHGSGAAGRQDT